MFINKFIIPVKNILKCVNGTERSVIRIKKPANLLFRPKEQRLHF